MAAHVCLGVSWELPGRPWQLLAAPGGSITSFSIILMSHHMLAMYIFIFAMCNLIHNHVISMDIGTMLYQESILISDHCLLCHLFLGPPSASLVSGGPTINMCPRENVSKVIAPWPLYYFNY